MTARSTILRQSALTRYAKAMRAAGVESWRIEIEPSGKVSITAGSHVSEATRPEDPTGNWLEDYNARSA